MKKTITFCIVFILFLTFSGYAQNKPNLPLSSSKIPSPVTPAKTPIPEAPVKVPEAVKKPVVAAPPLKGSPQANVAAPLNPEKKELGPGVGMALKFSSNGAGIEFSKSLSAHRRFVIRGFGTYMPFQFADYPFQFNKNVLLNINMNVKVGAVGLLFDVHPFKNSFKFTFGAAFMLLNAKGTAMMKDSVKQNDITLSPQEVGTINTEIHGSPIAPYIGFGFGRAIPRKRVGFSMEIGTYYIGSPQVSFVCTGMLEPTSNQQKVLQENLKPNQWLPQLMFNLNFRLSK